MELPLKTSKRMDRNNMWFGSEEKRFVRVPQELRDKCEFGLGDYIAFRTEAGGVISLQVTTAYKEDIEEDSSRAYVTSEMLDLIGIKETTGKYNVDLVTGITIGCDPEFFLIRRDSGEMVHAGRFFNKWGEVGYDHNGIVMEVRPMPSTDECMVASNMMSLLCKARAAINNIDSSPHLIKMHGASFYKTMTAGFHVHFGLPAEILGPGYPADGVAMQIVKALDYYVGIPCTIAEGPADYKRRTQPFVSYGKPGGYILDNRTLEYRVPGGSLLRHPVLSKGLLGLGAAVVEDAVSRIREATNDFKNLALMSTNGDIKELYPNLPSVHEMFFTICNQDVRIAMRKMDTIINDVEKMVSFKGREATIQDFFTSLLSEEEFNSDIEYNWRRFYHYEEQQRSVDVLSTSF